MNSIKFYVLCSKGLIALKRHLKTIPKKDLYVVINTLSPEFISSASEFCQREGIEYAITESDGTCATGKNSVLDIFGESSNDYGVFIDGDDYITEWGYKVYTTLVTGKKVPDVVALINQKGIKRDIVNWVLPIENDGPETDPDSIVGCAFYPFKRDKDWWLNILSLPEDSAMHKWAVQCQKYIMPEETHLRITFLSKKAAEMFRYDNQFKIGEDTLMYLNYKKAWSDGLIDLVHYDEEESPTYIYDSRVAGTVATVKGEDENSEKPLQWVKVLQEEYNKYEVEGRMVSDVVPVINR